MAITFSLSCGAFPVDTTQVVAFKGQEELGSPYAFEIWLTVTGLDETEIADVVGARARLILDDGAEETSFGGILASVDLVRSLEAFSLYRVTLVPSLWELNLTRHSRIFTKMSIDEVIRKVLDEEGLSAYELRLTSSYETEEHICQYQESSLAFLHRWMEREGLYYFFEQSEDGEKLIITDDRSSHVSLLTQAVPYRPGGRDVSASAHFREFIVKQSVLPLRINVTDYDYAKPQLALEGRGNLDSAGHGHMNYSNGRFFSPNGGDRLARIRAQALSDKASYIAMRGPVFKMSAGYTFTIKDHPKDAYNVELLAVSVEHTGLIDGSSQGWADAIPFSPAGAGAGHDAYAVAVTAIRSDVQYRLPARTPWPRIDGYESGIVDGEASSEYAQIDDQGRYLVRFRFDESGLNDGKASTYVRMMQPHAGSPEGWHFPLRKGTEVTFLFLGGDPDRPVIAGAVPNAMTPSPVTSANHTRNVIQTGGRNRFELEDLDGQQRITLSTPHANTTLLMGYAFEGHELIAKTDARGLWKTGAESDFLITGFWNIDVGKYKKEHVVGAVTETFESTKTETVTDLVTETYNKGQKTTVNAAKHELTNSAGYKVTTTAGHEETVTGGHKLEVTGLTDWKSNTSAKWDVTGAFDLTVNGKTTVTSAEKEEKVWGATHENKLGAVSELYGGLKHETVIGLTIDNKIGIHLDTMIGGKVETCVGPKLNIAFLHNEFDLCWSHTNPLSVAVKASDHEITALKNRANAMETRQNGMNHRMSGMSTRMNGLQNQINGLRNSTAGVHVVS